MTDLTILAILGFILTIGVFGSDLLKKIHFPEILGFLIAGVILNVSFLILGIDVVGLDGLLEIVVAVTLGFIGFNLGSEIDWNAIRSISGKILVILVFEVLLTFTLITIVVYLITQQFVIALIFGALASATAPAGTATIFWEQECRGPLTTATMFILTLDDILAIILIDFAIDYATMYYTGEIISLAGMLLPVIFDVGASILLGGSLGVMIVYFLDREDDHGEYVDLVIGSILVCIGIASIFGISYILPTMVFGITVSSLSKKSLDSRITGIIEESIGEISPELISGISQKREEKLDSEPHQIFHEVYKLASPIIALFFVLIGLTLDLASLYQIGFIGIIYIIVRSFSKIIGANLGAFVVKSEEVVQKYLGPCLLSQAGVALGLAVLVSERFASLGEPILGLFILNTITATTIIFQLVGPIAIKWAIRQSGEAA